MELKSVINGFGLWVASGVMVTVVIIQAILFLRAAFKEAERIQMPVKRCMAGIRAAILTSIGPALGPVVILVSLIAVLGAPTTWMRLNDIGAARTELAMATLATKVSGQDLRSPDLDIKGFDYCLWGMALNNVGWLILALLFTHRMGWGVKRLGEKFDPKWIKYLMAAAAIGLFAYLLTNSALVSKPIKMGNVYAALISGATLVAITKGVKKVPILLEPALGIAMIVGILAAAALD